MRLDKFVCQSTELSRQQAVQSIQQGEVRVNGSIVLLESTQVHEHNCIELNGQPLFLRAFRYFLVHKPAGTVCSHIDEVYPSVFNGLNIPNKDELHIVGRLDADTTGMLLLTNNGRWSFYITKPNSGCRKTYRVTLSKAILKKDAHTLVKRFAQGLRLQGEAQLTRPAELVFTGSKEALLTLTEGKFHQVKRMFAAIGNRVRMLHREQIGSLKLDVEEGAWRELTSQEVESLEHLKK